MSDDGKTRLLDAVISHMPSSNPTVLEITPDEGFPVWDKDNPPELFPKYEPKSDVPSREQLEAMLEMNPHLIFTHHAESDVLHKAEEWKPESSTGPQVIISNKLSPAEISERASKFAQELIKSGQNVLSLTDIDLAVSRATEEDVISLDTFAVLCARVSREICTKQVSNTYSNKEWEAKIDAQHKDVNAYAQRLLEATYNLPEGMIGIFDVQLGTYLAPGLLDPQVPLMVELEVETYSNPVYALIKNMDTPTVKAAVDRSIAALEGEEFTEQVNAMLMETTVAFGSVVEEKRRSLLELANRIPQLVGKVAPDNYKLWYLITRSHAYKDNQPNNMLPAIYADNQLAVQHQALTQQYMYSGLPQCTALDASFREVVIDIGEQKAKEKGLVDKAGKVIGTIAATPAKCKMSVEEAMYEAMGDYGDTWKSNNEAAKEYRRQLAEEKRKRDFELKKLGMQLEQQARFEAEQRELQEAYAKRDRAMEEARASLARATEQRRAFRQAQESYYSNADHMKYDRRNGYSQFNGDFAPQIPIPVLMLLVNLIVCLFLWLIFGNTVGMISAFGAVIATIGLFLYKSERDKGILITVAGYVLVVLAVMLH